MNVGTLVRVTAELYRYGQTGVIVKVHPPFLQKVVPTYSVLFWDEKIDEIAGACIEEIL